MYKKSVQPFQCWKNAGFCGYPRTEICHRGNKREDHNPSCSEEKEFDGCPRQALKKRVSREKLKACPCFLSKIVHLSRVSIIQKVKAQYLIYRNIP